MRRQAKNAGLFFIPALVGAGMTDVDYVARNAAGRLVGEAALFEVVAPSEWRPVRCSPPPRISASWRSMCSCSPRLLSERSRVGSIIAEPIHRLPGNVQVHALFCRARADKNC